MIALWNIYPEKNFKKMTTHHFYKKSRVTFQTRSWNRESV